MSQWFREQRLEWIVEMVQIYGFINREHIMKKFGVSVPQASIDLRDIMRQHPGLIEYNRSNKRYEKCASSNT